MGGMTGTKSIESIRLGHEVMPENKASYLLNLTETSFVCSELP